MTKIDRVVLAICVLFFLQAANCSYEQGQEAYPSLGMKMFGLKSAKPKAQQKKKIIDLTHSIREDMPSFGDADPIGEVTKLLHSMRNNSDYNLSELKMGVHTGTHLDAPGHFINEYYEAGLDVNGLDLDILVGPVLIVDAPRDTNITAQVLENVIPPGVQRVLFRTSNTDNRLMWNPKFDSSYIGFTEDGADWLVTHRPDVKLIGTDYLSVAAFSHLAEAHRVFLWKKLILVEGLNLEDVNVGLSNLYCLPIKLVKAEGAPARCILVD